MQGIAITLSGMLAVFLVGMVLVQGLSRRVDIFSMRNLYLASFIIYQIISPCTAIYNNDYFFFNVYSPDGVSKTYLVYLFTFMPVFLLSYHKLGITTWLARKFSGPPREISDSFFLSLALVIILIALPVRFLGPKIPAIAAASTQASIALAALASAIAGWVWGNRRFNLAVVGMMIFIVGSSLMIGMTGAFGRRPLLSILLGMAWGAYHRRFKLMKPGKMLINLLPLVVFTAVAVSAFTAIRDSRKTATAEVKDTMRSMTQANVGSGAQNIVTGQACGGAALWCMENFPDQIEPRILYSLKVMVCWYVPKALWPGKPVPLGNQIATLARLDGVHRDLITIPPGVLGYAAAEGGLFAALVYALFYGQFIRFFDELVRLNPFNPFIILPIGCATGQVLGLARGCIATFANLVVLGFISTFIVLYVARIVFGSRTPQTYYAPWPQAR